MRLTTCLVTTLRGEVPRSLTISSAPLPKHIRVVFANLFFGAIVAHTMIQVRSFVIVGQRRTSLLHSIMNDRHCKGYIKLVLVTDTVYQVHFTIIKCTVSISCYPLSTFMLRHTPPIRHADPNPIGETMTAVPTLRPQVLLHPLVSGATHQSTAQRQRIMQRRQFMLDHPHTTV